MSVARRIRRFDTVPGVHVLAGLLFGGYVTCAIAADAAPTSAPQKANMAASKPSTSLTGKSASSRVRFDADALTGLLADPLGGWKLVKLGKPIPAPAAGPQPAVEAAYERGADTAEMTISDDLPNAAKSGQRDLRESARTAALGRVVTLGLGNGLVITAESRTANGQALRALIESIDLARAEAMKPVAKH